MHHDVAFQYIMPWLTQYGSFALLVLLALGIFGLPIPDETILVTTGVLIARGHLSPITALPAVYFGAMIGITLSYIVGYAIGRTAILKFGRLLHITPERMEKAHYWFERIGKWFLLFGYYIPGVRHLSGIVAGTTYLKFWEFALFAYTGAVIWVSTFLGIGYFSYAAWLGKHFQIL